MDNIDIGNNNVEGTILGDNKFVIIPMKNRDIINIDQEDYTGLYNLFKKINKVEEALNILMKSPSNITGDDVFKALINLININDDNTETIFNFLLYIATESMKDLQEEYTDLIGKLGNQFYNSGINDAKHACSCNKEESNENKTVYNEYNPPEKTLFNDEPPEFEILGPDEVEEI